MGRGFTLPAPTSGRQVSEEPVGCSCDPAERGRDLREMPSGRSAVDGSRRQANPLIRRLDFYSHCTYASASTPPREFSIRWVDACRVAS